MNINEQYQFATEQMRASAFSVGIELDVSADALACIWCYEGDADPDHQDLSLSDYCNEQEFEEAKRLIKKFNSVSGRKLLFFLGEACTFQCGKTGYGRSWETEDDAKTGSFSKGRAFCDFAMSVGHASHLCAEYVSNKKPSKAGGLARSKKYKDEAQLVTAMYSSMAGLSNMSAEEAAGHILGRVSLSHRKIADTIRKERKVHDAKQNAQDA